MARKLLLDGRRVWLKDYAAVPPVRRVLDAVWNALAVAMGADLLRTPPRHPAKASCTLELRRIRELAALGVRVPPVLGAGSDALLLDDIGSALGRELRTAADPARVDVLVGQAFAGIADVHVRGGYLGQAFARNMAVAEAGIGFLDFEDDPLEIMPLADAQARDWLMFAFGIANYYHGRAGVLADMMTRLRPRVSAGVAQRVARVATRLGKPARVARYLGADGRAFATAVDALRRSFASGA